MAVVQVGAELETWEVVAARRDVAMGRVNAAAAELVAVTQDAIREGCWATAGCHSPEHWLRATAGLDAPRAGRIVRIARGLDRWPVLAVTFARGLVTEAAVDVVVRDCWHAYDGQLADAVGNWSIQQLHRMKRLFAPPPELPEQSDAPEEAAVERVGPDTFTCGWDDDGRFRGRFDLGASLGGIVATAVEAARRVVLRERGHDPGQSKGSVSGGEILARWAHAGLTALDPATSDERPSRPSDRYLTIVHVDAEHPERARIHLGPLVGRRAVEELTCDADVQPLLWRGGRPVGWGRRRRLADPLLRRLIEDRDQGCRSCGAPGFLHIHHLEHWTQGGRTDPDNLLALCTRCHAEVHAGRLRPVGSPTGSLEFLDADGRPRARPSPRAPSEPPASEPYSPIRGAIRYATLGGAPLPPPPFQEEYWRCN